MSEVIGGPWGAERLGAVSLLTEALRRIGRTPARFAALWLVGGGAVVAAQVAGEASGVLLPAAAGTPANLAANAGLAVIAGLSGALALRLAIAGPQGWLKVDGRLAQCAGLLALATAAFTAVNLVAIAGLRAGAPSEVGLSYAVVGVAGFATFIFVFSKLLLWPIGRLTGRPELTPARSWVLMRGALRAWLLANLLALLPLGAVVVGNIMAFGPQMADSTAGIALTMLANQAWMLAGQVMSAVICARRADATADVAAVFD